MQLTLTYRWQGKVPWNKGKSMSLEARKKMSAAKRLVVLPDQLRTKMSLSHIGQTHTPVPPPPPILIGHALASPSPLWDPQRTESPVGGFDAALSVDAGYLHAIDDDTLHTRPRNRAPVWLAKQRAS